MEINARRNTTGEEGVKTDWVGVVKEARSKVVAFEPRLASRTRASVQTSVAEPLRPREGHLLPKT